MRVAAQEHGRLHVFAVNRPKGDIALHHTPATTGANRLQPSHDVLTDLTGTPDLDPSGAELIPLEDLADLGLSGYLAEGYDVEAAALAPLCRKLDALEGYGLILRSSAFGGRAFTLAETADLTHIASFDQPGTDWSSSGTLPSEAAKPYSAQLASPREARARAQRMGGMIFAAFMVVIFAFLWMILE